MNLKPHQLFVCQYQCQCSHIQEKQMLMIIDFQMKNDNNNKICWSEIVCEKEANIVIVYGHTQSQSIRNHHHHHQNL